MIVVPSQRRRGLLVSSLMLTSCASLLGIELDVHPYSAAAEGGQGGQAGASEDLGVGGELANSGSGGQLSDGLCAKGCGEDEACLTIVKNIPLSAAIETACKPLACANQLKDPEEAEIDCGNTACGRCDQAPHRVLREPSTKLPLVSYRRSVGEWIASTSANEGSFLIGRHPHPGDAPVVGDFDGDAVLDYAAYNVVDASWSISTLEGNTWSHLAPKTYGLVRYSYIPTVAHFFATEADNLVLFQPLTGNWFAFFEDSTHNELPMKFGQLGDKPVPADYDGDGIDELAVYRNGDWLAKRVDGTLISLPKLGDANAIPVPCHYDADAKVDLGVFDRAAGTWTIIDAAGTHVITLTPKPLPGELAVAGDFTQDARCDPMLWDPSAGTWRTFDLNGNVIVP